MNVVKIKEMLVFLITYFNNIVISQNINVTKIDYELIFTFLCISHSFCFLHSDPDVVGKYVYQIILLLPHFFVVFLFSFASFYFLLGNKIWPFLECLFLCMIKTRHANKIIWPSALIIKGHRAL